MECQKCNFSEGTEKLHACPLQDDIYDDDTEQCNCCEECTHECAMDI